MKQKGNENDFSNNQKFTVLYIIAETGWGIPSTSDSLENTKSNATSTEMEEMFLTVNQLWSSVLFFNLEADPQFFS